jgi:hypothetical protein
MKRYLAALALFSALAHPASAITFPSLTTIYVGSGVRDGGQVSNAGVATSLHCSNVSGQAASLRILVLHQEGSVAGSLLFGIAHGSTAAFSTHFAASVTEAAEISPGVIIVRGVVNVESTQSGIFCNAVVLDAASGVPNGVELPLVRVNPHPGTGSKLALCGTLVRSAGAFSPRHSALPCCCEAAGSSYRSYLCGYDRRRLAVQ